MNRLIKVTLWIAGFLVLPLLIGTNVSATDPPIAIKLYVEKSSYMMNEPVKMQIIVLNNSGQDVIPRKGFYDQEFHMMLTFTDPDGKPVHCRYLQVGKEPGPPSRVQERDAAFVETFLNGSNKITDMNDAHAYYDLTKYGRYKAQVFADLETFSQSTTDPLTGALIAFLDDPGRLSFSLASNEISLEIRPPTPVVKSSVQVHVELLKIGTGSKPPTTKTPLENVAVHLIRTSDVPADYQPINFKTYELIWGNVIPVASSLTDSKGIARFENVAKDDYVIIALSDRSVDFKHMGSQVEASDPDWNSGQPIEKYLKVMEKANGNSNPGKTTKKTGSLLLITEPEYIEWNSTQELYPFVFETVGDWGITTSVNPPEGFVADRKSLSADVTNEVESVQFTITDVGSRWEETEVTYKIKHEGKNEVVKSKIGIKLSRKLAGKKGLGIYGDTEDPGTFKGGKKEKDK